MRIVRLTAENVKRLKAVEIQPNGDVVVIAGRNGQGKTSVLDSIWFALGGGAAQKGTQRPIRDGEDQAQVILDLGDLVVTRTWKGEKSVLTVGTQDGATYNSPQGLLDKLIGRLSFDPLAFTQQDERSQLATLLDLVELPFDPDELAAKRKTLYDQRTEVGREIKALEGQLVGLPEASDLPMVERSAADILEEQRQHQAAVAEYDALYRMQNDSAEAVEDLVGEIREAEARLSRVRALHADAVEVHKEAQREAEEVKQPPTVDFQARLAEVEETNRAVREQRERAAREEDLADARARVRSLTDAIDQLDGDKTDALANAKMPIEGLAFDDTGVTYKGIPFAQCSASERLRVSMAMALALNPTIRVIRITDGSLLDSDSLRMIAEMAAERDAQIWLEKVDESGQVGIVIEDGEVSSINGVPQ